MMMRKQSERVKRGTGKRPARGEKEDHYEKQKSENKTKDKKRIKQYVGLRRR